MRRRTLFAAAFALVLVAAAAAETARPASAYAMLEAADAGACARLCAGDGICMAWAFRRENRCELSAVVPAALDSDALAAGFAARAPAFLTARAAPAADIAALAAPAEPAPPPAPAHARLGPETADDSGLLGGPGEGDLRL